MAAMAQLLADFKQNPKKTIKKLIEAKQVPPPVPAKPAVHAKRAHARTCAGAGALGVHGPAVRCAWASEAGH
jgi:hypothetical protein